VGYTPAPPGWWQEFVRSTARPAVLAVTRLDGSPHAAPVWIDLDTDDDGADVLVFTTHRETIKGKSIVRDGRVCLTVDDDTPPFSFVTITGRATVSEDPDELLRWATRIGGRYMGADRAEEYGRRNGVPGEMVVRVRADKVVAKVDIAD
jgi:PPOX class probable F420-dependent enzyme